MPPPTLDKLPRVSIGRFPTPVERMRALSKALDTDVWCKRDDLTSTRYGGNKVRKLEFLIGDALARGRDSLVTAGAAGSHHMLATSVFGAAHGLEVHGVLCPQPWTEHVEADLRADLGAGAIIHPVRSFGAVPGGLVRVARELRAGGKKPYVVGPGGSSPVGCLGYVEAGLELGRQIREGAMPEPDAIFVAFGTGGTAAGAAIGLAASGVECDILAVRVTDKRFSSRLVLRALVSRTLAKIRRVSPRFPDVRSRALAMLRVAPDELGPGYGEETPRALEAIELAERDRLEVEITYTSKALAGLVHAARGERRGQRLLYWHTLSSAEMKPLLKNAPPVPRELRRALFSS